MGIQKELFEIVVTTVTRSTALMWKGDLKGAGLMMQTALELTDAMIRNDTDGVVPGMFSRKSRAIWEGIDRCENTVPVLHVGAILDKLATIEGREDIKGMYL